MKIEHATSGGSEDGQRLRTHLIVSAPGSSRMYDLVTGDTLHVGRSPELQVVVDDPLVSRLHAQIDRRPDGVYIVDRGSANGTWVNGSMIGGEILLRAGDEIKLGATVITVVETSPPPLYRRDVLPQDRFMNRLEHELVNAREEGEPLVVVLMLLAHIPAPMDLVQKRVLEMMSAGDSVGHGTDGELVLLKPGESRHRAESMVRKFVEKTVEVDQDVTGIGVSVFPDDGMDSRSLLDAARKMASVKDWKRVSRTPPLQSASARSVTLVSGVSDQPDPEKDFIVRDPAMLNLMKTARKVAVSDAPALITGETGAGKEVLARFIHRASPRTDGPLVKVNCATLPPALIEAELFGHEKGAFTGAEDQRVGFLESANLGTLILDEITELPGAVQVKLLRFLDDYTINRVGKTDELLLDVRVIALTNRDVEEEVRIGSFRQDLFYRLGTFHLYVPPLRSRREDIVLLAEYFARKVAGRFEMQTPSMSKPFVEGLQAHSWPGNVRELRNAMEAAVIQSEQEVLRTEHLPGHIASATEGHATRASKPPGTIKQKKEQAEAEEIRKALQASGGVQKTAAEILGISRRTLWAKIKRYGIEIKKTL